ncbi:hypothetical protein [Pseudomonas sp. NPDC089534]|uniref:hypothetical protein n=1 Tax=Pseudomonas sp. NPDC089534 TaxID=3364468 RepID=UPI0038063CEB
MDTFIGVCAGVIGIILGVIGVIASLHPPKANSTKMLVIGLFVVLSALAVTTTIIDRQWAQRQSLEVEHTLSSLKGSLSNLTELNAQLSRDNVDLREKIDEAAKAPQRLALQQTLKHDIERHLEQVSEFISTKTEEFEKGNWQASGEERVRQVERFRSQLAGEYVSKFFFNTRALLLRAVELELIPPRDFAIDGRFIEAGLIPYLDDLRALHEKMPD